jgi:hypothetical protein
LVSSGGLFDDTVSGNYRSTPLVVTCVLQSNPRNRTLSKKRMICECLNKSAFVHYFPHNSPLYMSVLWKQNRLHTFIFRLNKASATFGRFLLPTLKTSKCPLYFRFSGNNFVSICCLSHIHCMPQPLILREGITLMLLKFYEMCKLYNDSLCVFLSLPLLPFSRIQYSPSGPISCSFACCRLLKSRLWSRTLYCCRSDPLLPNNVIYTGLNSLWITSCATHAPSTRSYSIFYLFVLNQRWVYTNILRIPSVLLNSPLLILTC